MRTILLCFSLFLGVFASAQTDEEQQALAVVNRVFEAMRTNDSTLLKSCFHSKVRMSTVAVDKEGNTRLHESDLAGFAKAVGTPKDDVWNEPIWNERVQIDGDLAAVWVDYAFYINDRFSHCGVDAFHLVRVNGEWKIFNLVDTRRKTDCNVPQEIQGKFGKG